MVPFRVLSSVVFIVGVLQVCTASPVVSDESDAKRIYSDDELLIAKNVGLSNRDLVEGKLYGFTFDEIVKMYQLRGNTSISRQDITFEYMTKTCEILEADHKTATAHTTDQQERLQDLVGAMSFLLDHDQAPFIRSTLCGYISQPDSLDTEANSFGLEFIPFMEIRYLKVKAAKVSGLNRVRMAKEMCCMYQNLDTRTFLLRSKVGGLTDEELNAFDLHWNEFLAVDTAKSLEKVCNHLEGKLPNDECIIAVPV